MMDKMRPWYKEFWPWFLMLFPAAAVVGGIMTYYVAAQNNDGVVEDDYYKQGMSINRTLTRDRAAMAIGLSGQLSLTGGAATLELSGHVRQWPERLVLRILHPTRSGMDQSVLLESQGGGRYSGPCKVAGANKWNVLLEDEQKTWRLAGHIDAGSSKAALMPVQ
jgi:hypothetical protein